MSQPNLFNWATSELSQDAFICWLLEWAKPEYQSKNKELHELSVKLINLLTNSAIEIRTLEVRRQYKNIDILVIINNVIGLLIEDKIHSKEHGEQLVKYAELLGNEIEDKNLYLIYFKTGDQSNYQNIKNKGYTVFGRTDFLSLLNTGYKTGIRNEIFIDFYEHLRQIEQAVQSYKSLPLDKWNWDSWKGFYLELQNLLGVGEWDYVPQKNGGFLGFWWHWKDKELNGTGYDYYLQLEHQKFCFKLMPDD